MVEEFIKDKVYYKIFNREYKSSTAIYSKHKYEDAAKIAEIDNNLAAVKSEFTAKDIMILKQMHGNDIVCADIEDANSQPAADASFTTKKDMVLAVQTADCVPVLFSCKSGKLIAAAHCGWRSAKSDIIKNVKKQMSNQGAEEIKAIIGPAIAQLSYEVSSSYYNDFITDSNHYAKFFVSSVKPDHYMFNLPSFVKEKLNDSEIEVVNHIDEDTYSLAEKYPSYRRSCHTDEKYSESILSAIVIKR